MSKQMLPKNWQSVKIGDIANVMHGGTPSKSNKEFWVGNIPWVSPKDMRPVVIEDTIDHITLEAINGSSTRLIPRGTILIVARSGILVRILPVSVAGTELAFNQDIKALSIDTDLVDAWFLVWWLKSQEPHILMNGVKKGATVHSLKTGFIEALELPLPPLAEQQRITAIIEEHMSDIDVARIAIEAELEAVEALTASYLRQVFESDEAEEWEQCKLGDVLIRSTEIVHPHDHPKGAATFVGLEHIESGTGRRLGSLEVEMSELTGRKPQFYKGQLVYGYLRPYLNKVWIAEFDGLCSVDQYIYSINSDLAITEYIFWFMLSPVYMDRSPVGSNTSQLPRIRLEEVAAVEFGLPSLEEQRHIVNDIQCAVEEINHACSALGERLQAINAMTAAVLRRAFNGDL